MGAIIINHEGYVMGTMHICKNFKGNAFVVECLCFFHVVQLGIESDFEELILESDAKQVVEYLIKGKAQNRNMGGNFV